MRNALISTAVTFAVVWLATSGAARGWLLLSVLAAGMFWALSSSAQRGQPTAKGRGAAPVARQLPVRAASVAGWLWRKVLRRGIRAGRDAAGSGVERTRRTWGLRRRRWEFGPRHPETAAGDEVHCAYCFRSFPADKVAAHIVAKHPGANVPTRPPQDSPPPADAPRHPPGPAPKPADQTEEPEMPPPALNPMGTAGKASISGLVLDWQSSVEARSDPETFVMWLRSQAAAARYAATMVDDLVREYHGRGPHDAGVPKEIIDRFTVSFVDARTAEATAYDAFAAAYAAYHDDAVTQMRATYGREVLASAAGPGRA